MATGIVSSFFEINSGVRYVSDEHSSYLLHPFFFKVQCNRINAQNIARSTFPYYHVTGKCTVTPEGSPSYYTAEILQFY